MIGAAADPGGAAPPPVAPRLHPAYAIAAAAVLFACVAGYGAWRLHLDVRARLENLAGSLETARADRERLATALEGLRRDAESQAAAAARAEAERKALAGELATLKETAGRGRIAFDAAIAEAEYFAFLAVQRLAADYDPAGATAALQSADALLAAVNHPDLASVRTQLARDREALGGASVPDVRQLALELTRAEHDLDGLPLRGAGTAAATGPGPARSGWRGVLEAMWRDVLSLIEVRDAVPGDDVLLDPARRALLRQDLRQELAVAKYAALRRDTTDFRAAIGVVLATLRAQYDVQDAAVAALASRLEDAKSLDLAPALPAIGGTLEALRAWRAKNVADTAPAEGAGH